LIKVTSLVVAAPLLYLVVVEGADLGSRGARYVQGGRSRRLRLQLMDFGAIVILPSIAWYWHAHQVAQRFYPHHFFGESGIRIENFSWYWNIARLTATSSFTPILSILAIIGLFPATA